jgi:RNA-directed DNA polymerase
MATGLENVAAKARSNTNLKFTSLAHHVTQDTLLKHLKKMPAATAVGVDSATKAATKDSFGDWAPEMLTAMHRQGYKAPPVRRVEIPKPGKNATRPIGIPTVSDRALQGAVSEVLAAIYEQDFLPCSYGGRPGRSAHHALSKLHLTIASCKVSWIFECDLKNFFGSLDHGWVERFVAHRVGDPRIMSLIGRWLKAGVMNDGEFEPSEIGTPQGGPISVLISNVYLHYVLDLWIDRVVKPRLRGEVHYVRYLDDFVLCFQHHSDALKFQEVLSKRLAKFSLVVEPSKTRLVEFGRFAQREAKASGGKAASIYFLGFTLYCTRNAKGNFKVGIKTEKSRLKRSIAKLTKVMLAVRHQPLRDQSKAIDLILAGTYRYYGLAGNIASLERVHRFVLQNWRRTLSSRSQRGRVNWERYAKILKAFPIREPKIYVTYGDINRMASL